MRQTFEDCTNLIGTITINANPDEWTACLYGTQITEVVGDTTMANEFMATNPTE